MKFTAKHKLIAGLTLFIFPLYAFCLWLYIFNTYSGLQQSEKVTQFNRYIIFSDNPAAIPILSIVLSVASAIILGRLTFDNLLLKVFVYAIIVANVFLIALNSWSLL